MEQPEQDEIAGKKERLRCRITDSVDSNFPPMRSAMALNAEIGEWFPFDRQPRIPLVFTRFFAKPVISRREAPRSCQRSFMSVCTLRTLLAAKIGNIRSPNSWQSGGKKTHGKQLIPQTAWPDTSHTNTKFGALTFWLLSISAQACNTSHNLPGQNIDLYFERNSTQVSAGQVLKLANWAIDMRLKYPIQEVLSIGGLAEASEKEPKKLAVQRADTAKAILMQFDLTETSYDVRAGIYKPLDYFVEPSEKVRRAEIELSPGCPNNCCDGK